MRNDAAALLTPLRERLRTLCALENSGGFLRRCQDDDFLLVTDLPSHGTQAQVEACLQALDKAGIPYGSPKNMDFLAMDAPLAWFVRLLDGLPTSPPPLPQNQALHPAYALCRLLLLHPAPPDRQPLAPLRRVLKGAEAGDIHLLQAIQPLHEASAALLRQHRPLPTGAGQVLAAWLTAHKEACP